MMIGIAAKFNFKETKMRQPLIVVPLKKVCAWANVDPKTARRILREKGKRPGGRWAWSDAKAKKIVELLKKEVANGHSV